MVTEMLLISSVKLLPDKVIMVPPCPSSGYIESILGVESLEKVNVQVQSGQDDGISLMITSTWLERDAAYHNNTVFITQANKLISVLFALN